MTTAIAPRDEAQGFTRDQVELVKRTIAKGVSDDELALFIQQCKRTGLDPFSRQIYCVKRKEYDRDSGTWIDKAVTQVSIDGFRLVAERTGQYEGQTAPQWCAEDGAWREVWLSDKPPTAARVGVWRHNFREPAWGVARFAAYAQTKRDGSLTAMWARMPDVMIAKCAEALALRKAFPQELSGLYTADEMGQAENALTQPAKVTVETPKELPAPPPGAQFIKQHVESVTDNFTTYGKFILSDGREVVAKGAQLVAFLEQCAQLGTPLELTTRQVKSRKTKELREEIEEAVRWKDPEIEKAVYMAQAAQAGIRVAHPDDEAPDADQPF